MVQTARLSKEETQDYKKIHAITKIHNIDFIKIRCSLLSDFVKRFLVDLFLKRFERKRDNNLIRMADVNVSRQFDIAPVKAINNGNGNVAPLACWLAGRNVLM